MKRKLKAISTVLLVTIVGCLVVLGIHYRESLGALMSRLPRFERASTRTQLLAQNGELYSKFKPEFREAIFHAADLSDDVSVERAIHDYYRAHIRSVRDREERSASTSVIQALKNSELLTYGGRVSFKRPFDWEEERFHDYEATLLLNRHSFLGDVARVSSGSEQLAVMQRVVPILESWLSESKEAKYLSGGTISVAGRQFLWMPKSYWLNSGTRLLGPWREFLPVAARTEYFDSHLWITLVRMVYNQTAIIETSMTPGDDRFAIACGGLIVAGTLFPELSDSDRWIEIGLSGLRQSLDELFTQEGAFRAMSPHYAAVTLRAIVTPLLILRDTGYPLERKILERVKEISGYLNSIAFPNGELPALKVSDRTDFLPLRRLVDALVENSSDVVSPTTHGSAELTAFYPRIGQGVIRAGAGTLASVAILDNGPMGTLPHEDALNVLFYGRGAHLLDDGGRHSYTGERVDQHLSSSAAHSVLFVDEQGHNRSSCAPSSWLADSGDATSRSRLQSVTIGALPGLRGVFCGPWSSSAKVKQIRTVLLVSSDLILIHDSVFSLDGAAHAFTTNFQLGPGAARIDGSQIQFASRESSSVLSLQQIRRNGTSVVPAVLAPDLATGRGHISPSYLQLVSAPTVQFRAAKVLSDEIVTIASLVSTARERAVELSFCKSEEGVSELCISVNQEPPQRIPVSQSEVECPIPCQ